MKEIKLYTILQGNGFWWKIMKIDGDKAFINEQPDYGQPNDFTELYEYSIGELQEMINKQTLYIV